MVPLWCVVISPFSTLVLVKHSNSKLPCYKQEKLVSSRKQVRWQVQTKNVTNMKKRRSFQIQGHAANYYY